MFSVTVVKEKRDITPGKVSLIHAAGWKENTSDRTVVLNMKLTEK